MTFTIGALLMLICIVWFVVLSVQRGQSTGEKVVWVIVNLLFQPIAGIIFFLIKKDGLLPMILGIIGTVIYGYGWFTSIGEVMNQVR
ncbi:MAG TPA: hypothetical protein VNK26_02405 [Pyrinomonadaceae bacterium]|jgi:hypothetical protein|nr:hypothetical protein [Pyrinomonadaceae bacterium]